MKNFYFFVKKFAKNIKTLFSNGNFFDIIKIRKYVYRAICGSNLNINF